MICDVKAIFTSRIFLGKPNLSSSIFYFQATKRLRSKWLRISRYIKYYLNFQLKTPDVNRAIDMPPAIRSAAASDITPPPAMVRSQPGPRDFRRGPGQGTGPLDAVYHGVGVTVNYF